MKRALVIDDSRAMRTILARQLEALGFAVAQAGNGRAALVGAPAPELARVDWNMPELGGLDLVTAVRGQRHFDELTLLAVVE